MALKKRFNRISRMAGLAVTRVVKLFSSSWIAVSAIFWPWALFFGPSIWSHRLTAD
jgi:hypothetical protein